MLVLSAGFCNGESSGVSRRRYTNSSEQREIWEILGKPVYRGLEERPTGQVQRHLSRETFFESRELPLSLTGVLVSKGESGRFPESLYVGGWKSAPQGSGIGA